MSRPNDDTYFRQTRLVEAGTIFGIGIVLVILFRDPESGPTFVQGVGLMLMLGAAYLRYPILRSPIGELVNRIPKFANRPSDD